MFFLGKKLRFIGISLGVMVTLYLTTLSLSFAAERLNTILEKKILRVGTPGDYRPFAMLTENGEYQGFDIEVIRKIAAELGVEIEFIATSWPKLMEDFQADNFDVALGGISRNVNRVINSEFLPGYAPFGKVAIIRKEDKDKFITLDQLNQPDVRVIKNPGGTNEKFVLEHLTNTQIATHQFNAEIPALIAEGKGDVMISETYEALLYAKKDPRLYAAFVDHPLTPVNRLGFMLQKDDADFVRTMNFIWNLLEEREEIQHSIDTWLK